MRRFTTLPANLILVLLLTSCQSAPSFEPLNESWATAQLAVPTENKQRAEALRKTGFQLYKQKRDSEAIIQYEAALQLHAHAGLYYDYANSLSNIDGRLEDSIKAYRIGIRLSEKPDMNLHYNLGCALVRANRIAEAIPELQLAYRLGKPPAIMEQDGDLTNLRKDRDWREKIGIKEPVRSWLVLRMAGGSAIYQRTICANARKTFGFVLEYQEDNGQSSVKKGNWTREGNKIIAHFKQEIGKKGVGPTVNDGPRGPYHLKFEPYEREIDETVTFDFMEISRNMQESDGPCPEYRF